MKRRLLTWGHSLTRYLLAFAATFLVALFYALSAVGTAANLEPGGFIEAGMQETLVYAFATVMSFLALNIYLRVIARGNRRAFVEEADAYPETGGMGKPVARVLRSADFWIGIILLFVLLFLFPSVLFFPNLTHLVKSLVPPVAGGLLRDLVILLIGFGVGFLLNLFAHTDARQLWRQSFLRGGANADRREEELRGMKKRLWITFPLLFVFWFAIYFFSPALIRIFSSVMWVILQAKLYIVIPAALLVYLLYRYFRAWRYRLSVLKRIENTCAERKYRFRRERGAGWLLLGHCGEVHLSIDTGKTTYSCILVDCPIKRNRVIFDAEGYTVVHRVGFYRLTFLHFQTRHPWRYQEAETPIVLCLPVHDDGAYMKVETAIRPLHTTTGVGQVTIHDEDSVLALLRGL